MFYAKWQSVDVSKEEMKKFKNLLYSSKNSNAACRKLNELYNTNLDGALVYYSNIFSRIKRDLFSRDCHNFSD